MKPRIIDKILLAFILLIFIGIMVCVVLFVTGVFPKENVTALMDRIMGNGLDWGYIRIGIIAAAGILGIIAVKLLFTGSKPKEKKEKGEEASLLSSDENGSAYITAVSIDSMAQKYVKSNGRIRECVSKVVINPESDVDIALKAVVLADTNIPELSEKVRRELKEYIETYGGVKVSNVKFVVTNTYSPNTAPRVS